MAALARATDALRRTLVDAVELAGGRPAGSEELATALGHSLAGVPPTRSGRLRRAWLHVTLGRRLAPSAVEALERAGETARGRGDRHLGREHLAAVVAAVA